MTLTEFSRKGGTAGTGESKRRSPEHYQRIARLSVASRLRKWASANGGQAAIRSLTKSNASGSD